MSLGSWDPAADAAAQNIHVEPATLARFIALSETDKLDQLEELISGAESQELSGLMKLDADVWTDAAQTLSEDETLHLLRFFAMAENLPGWEAGDQSPVIPLAKSLRKRGVRLDKELLKWLRSVNDNRFLPYGPL
ncbi:MAG: hypothetical protein ACI9DH_000155 [Halioglobus sp.]|jgi:hypothetical protein